MTYRDPWTGRFAKEPTPAPARTKAEYRVVTTIGGIVTPRGLWRDSERQAMDDARAEKLASYDESQREWFLAVPVSIQTRKV